MPLIISTSLNLHSRSRVAAEAAYASGQQQEIDCQFIDLNQTKLPFCNAGDCYAFPEVQQVSELIQNANGIIIASPVYNYSASSSAKNLIELTGKAWTEKVVGFICAAGGQGSYMSMMPLANSLMLDFRTFIVPRFVYLTGEHFEGDRLADDEIENRLGTLVKMVDQVATRLRE